LDGLNDGHDSANHEDQYGAYDEDDVDGINASFHEEIASPQLVNVFAGPD
jgi:hypothetical protein